MVAIMVIHLSVKVNIFCHKNSVDVIVYNVGAILLPREMSQVNSLGTHWGLNKMAAI